MAKPDKWEQMGFVPDPPANQKAKSKEPDWEAMGFVPDKPKSSFVERLEKTAPDIVLGTGQLAEMRFAPLLKRVLQKQLISPEAAAASVPAQFALGAGRAAQEPVYQAGDIINRLLSKIPGVNIPDIPRPPAGEGFAGEMGEQTGSLLPFIGGGEALAAGVRGAEELPAVGRIAQVLGEKTLPAGVARRAIGFPGYEALMHPGDRAKAAQQGLLTSMLLDVIPGMPEGTAPLTEAFKPQKYAESLMQHFGQIKPALKEGEKQLGQNVEDLFSSLGSGKSLEQSGKELAKQIRTNYQIHKAVGQGMYKSVFDKAGDWNIYSSPRGFLTNNYKNLEPAAVDALGRMSDISKLDDKFRGSHNFEDAHTLQSQLGSRIRELEKKNTEGRLTINDQNTMRSLRDVRNTLNLDIDNFLKHRDYTGDISREYRNASQNWLKNVVPYVENPKISQMAKGAIENPRNIANVFRNPENGTLKVIDDLGEQGKRRIIYSSLANVNKTKPESIVNALNSMENKGLDSFLTPHVHDHVSKITDSIENYNQLKGLNKEIEKVKTPKPERVVEMLKNLDRQESSSVFPDLQSQLANLEGKIKRRNIAQTLGGVAAGGILAHPFSRYVPTGTAELLGGAAGGLGAMPFIRAANGRADLFKGVAEAVTAPTTPKLYEAAQPGLRLASPALYNALSNIFARGRIPTQPNNTDGGY
jgi:hypothetical protein